MYHVIKMSGPCEPWWFLEDWEEDVVSREVFERYEDALSYYQAELQILATEYPCSREKSEEKMIAFWNPADQFWCSECGENLQRYHSLLLLTGSPMTNQDGVKGHSSLTCRSIKMNTHP